MKTFKYIGLFLVALILTFSCTEEDVDEVLVIDHTGGLLDVVSSSLSYVVGNNATYPVDLVAYNGSNPIQKIEVYNTYSTSTGELSNTALLKTIDVTPSGNQQAINFSVTFEDLIQGIIFDGGPLSNDDSGLNIGDGFTLTYVAYTESGDVSTSDGKTKLTVSTRYAGLYKVVSGTYWRIGVLRDDVGWPEFVQIESVDAITYRMILWYGAFDGDDWLFEVQPDLTITYPLVDGAPQAPTGYPQVTCELEPASFPNADCSTSNYVEQDDVNGKDRMYMVYGYFFPDGGGASEGVREFEAIYEKVVE